MTLTFDLREWNFQMALLLVKGLMTVVLGVFQIFLQHGWLIFWCVIEGNMVKTVFERAENSVERGENAGNQQFLLFLHGLQPLSKGIDKTWDSWVMG